MAALLVMAASTGIAAPRRSARAAATSNDGVVLNSSTTPDAYHQQAIAGHRKHDFSPRTPPRRGRFVYGHWTPYSPPDPTSLPAGTKTHVIASGDTLWDISNKYYRDPYLWPYLWEANSWVTYPHWIYPGDTLIIPALMMLPQGQLQESLRLPGILDGFYPAADNDAIHCGYFLSDPNRKFPAEIIAAETDPAPVLLTTNDVVYINVGAKDGVLPGDEFAIIYPRQHLAVSPTEREYQKEQVHHPVTGEALGYAMKMAGRLKIMLLGEDVSTARIVNACDEVEVGFRLVPFTESPIPLTRRKDRERYFNEMPQRGRGFIVFLEDEEIAGAPGQLLSIDLGSRQGVIPGDVFRIYRDQPSNIQHEDTEHLGRLWDFHQGVRASKQRRDIVDRGIYGKQRPVPKAPPRVVGTIVVLYTELDTATCQAQNGPTEFYMGDRIVYEPVDTGLDSVATVDYPMVPDVPVNRQPPVRVRGEQGEEGDKEFPGRHEPSRRRRR